MRPAVRSAFYGVNKLWEGETTWLYLDIKGLVTIGVGNLVDPMAAALDLPMFRTDGSPAPKEDIAHAWRAVKARTDLAHHGGGAFAGITALRMTSEGVRMLVNAKLGQQAAVLAARFGNWSSWPADAQLAIACLAWAIGPAFRWPKLEAALARGDFAVAADECVISTDGNPGVRPRNAGMRLMLMNAAHVVAEGTDRDVLHYPRTLSTQEAPTLPMLVDPPSEPTFPGPRESSPVLEEDGGVARWMATRAAVRGEDS